MRDQFHVGGSSLFMILLRIKERIPHQGNLESTVVFPSLNGQKEMEELSSDCESEDDSSFMVSDSVSNAYVQTIDTNTLKTVDEI